MPSLSNHASSGDKLPSPIKRIPIVDFCVQIDIRLSIPTQRGEPLPTRKSALVNGGAIVRRQRRLLTHTPTGNGRGALYSSRIRRSGHRVQAIQERRVLVAGHSREPVLRETALATTVRRTHSRGTSRRLPVRGAMATATASRCSRRQTGTPNQRKGQPTRLDTNSVRRPVRAGTQTTRCVRARC